MCDLSGYSTYVSDGLTTVHIYSRSSWLPPAPEALTRQQWSKTQARKTKARSISNVPTTGWLLCLAGIIKPISHCALKVSSSSLKYGSSDENEVDRFASVAVDPGFIEDRRCHAYQ